MVHLITFRSAPGFVQAAKGTIYGQHERIELGINQRKYVFNATRKGYNIPHSSEWRMMEYRIKKEVLPEFIRDLNGINLNPENNDMSLYKIITYKNPIKNHHWDTAGIGTGLMFVQLIFKWINHFDKLIKFVTRGKIELPIKPVPVKAKGEPKCFADGWHYTFFIGTMPDNVKAQGEEL